MPATGADGCCLCPPPSLLVPVHVRGERCRGRCQGGISVGVAWRIDQRRSRRHLQAHQGHPRDRVDAVAGDGTNVAAVGNAPGHRAGQVLHRRDHSGDKELGISTTEQGDRPAHAAFIAKDGDANEDDPRFRLEDGRSAPTYCTVQRGTRGRAPLF